MWNFIISLLSNRLGIVLATLNICLVTHILINNLPVNGIILVKMIIGLNIPALFLGILFLETLFYLFFDIPRHEFINSAQLLLPLFVPIQWLIIAWVAKIIALKLRKTNL